MVTEVTLVTTVTLGAGLSTSPLVHQNPEPSVSTWNSLTGTQPQTHTHTITVTAHPHAHVTTHTHTHTHTHTQWKSPETFKLWIQNQVRGHGQHRAEPVPNPSSPFPFLRGSGAPCRPLPTGVERLPLHLPSAPAGHHLLSVWTPSVPRVPPAAGR